MVGDHTMSVVKNEKCRIVMLNLFQHPTKNMHGRISIHYLACGMPAFVGMTGPKKTNLPNNYGTISIIGWNLKKAKVIEAFVKDRFTIIYRW